MNILVVEDDEGKRNSLLEFTLTLLDASISIARSRQSGVRALVNGKFDLVMLDMTMPTYDITPDEDGGRPQPYAGRDILRQMDRRGINTPAIIVTQFDRFGEGENEISIDELSSQLKIEFPQIYVGTVYYNIGYEDWKGSLAYFFSKLTNQQYGI